MFDAQIAKDATLKAHAKVIAETYDIIAAEIKLGHFSTLSNELYGDELRAVRIHLTDKGFNIELSEERARTPFKKLLRISWA